MVRRIPYTGGMQPTDYMLAAYAVTAVLIGGLIAATLMAAHRTRRALAQQPRDGQ